MTPEGRKWAAGNPDGSMGAAEGEAVLGGYVVKLNDGTTQYQVKVLNGTAVPFFRTTGDSFIARARSTPTSRRWRPRASSRRWR